MTRLAVLAALAISAAMLFGQDNAAPKLPRIDKNACPFECCQFGQWTATKSVSVFSTWKRTGREQKFHISKGEKVTAITGVHITYKPGMLRARATMPDLNVRPGDTILTYMYRGEGEVDSWANGRWLRDQLLDTVIISCSQAGKPQWYPICLVSEGEKEWWVLVKTSSGKQGWVKGNEGFDGADACA